MPFDGGLLSLHIAGSKVEGAEALFQQSPRATEFPPRPRATEAPAGRGNVQVHIDSKYRAPLQRRLQSRLIALGEWEGRVEAINNETFTARIIKIPARPEAPEELAEFFAEDIAPDDLSLLRSGAIFRWIVGYREFAMGQVERTSKIAFRRLPAYTAGDIRRSEEEASRIARSIAVR